MVSTSVFGVTVICVNVTRVVGPSDQWRAWVPLPDSVVVTESSLSLPVYPNVYLEAGFYELECLVSLPGGRVLRARVSGESTWKPGSTS